MRRGATSGQERQRPPAAKQRQRQEQLAAESDTLRAISEEYLRREGPRLRTLSQRRADLELLCASVLGRLPVAEIKRGQYTRVLDHIADHNGLARADRVLSAAKTLLNWHAGRSDFISPLGRGGRRTSIRERARERVLTDDELRRVWLAADQDKGPFGPFVRFVLLTATRRGEAGGLRRSELSDGGRTWVIPGVRYKSGKDTLIPLSAAAQRIIAERPQLGGGHHVFSAATARNRSVVSTTARKPSTRSVASAAGDYTTCGGQPARCYLALASVPTMLKCVSATRWVASAEHMIATPTKPRSAMPSKRWPR